MQNSTSQKSVKNSTCSFDLEGLVLFISSSYSWIGASLHGIRCHCSDPSVVEINVHLKERTLTLKLLSCYQHLVEKKVEVGNYFLDKNHLH